MRQSVGPFTLAMKADGAVQGFFAELLILTTAQFWYICGVSRVDDRTTNLAIADPVVPRPPEDGLVGRRRLGGDRDVVFERERAAAHD